MRFALILIIMLAGAIVASGAPENKTLGPYNVSFDLNTTMNYSILYAKPIVTPTSTTYMMMIKTNNSSLANTAIIEYKNITDSTLNYHKLQAERVLINNGFSRNMSSINAHIDGKKGFVHAGINSKKFILFFTGFWLDSKDCDCGPVSVGKTKVEMISSYPPEITWNLLNSIHVEKSQITGQDKQPQTKSEQQNQQKQTKPMIFAPPKQS